MFGNNCGKDGKKPGPAVYDDLCVVVDSHGREHHQFLAGRPNQLWLSDMTEHKLPRARSLSARSRTRSRARLSATRSARQKMASLAVRAIRNAVAMRRNVNGCIVHSDRRSHFRSWKLRHEISRHNLVGSMGRVASCGDNAAMESFFSLLQKNVLNRHTWATREELRIAIVTWIERTYHRRRRQLRLGRLTPIEFETIVNKNLVLAT